jgi:hypothetical protein
VAVSTGSPGVAKAGPETLDERLAEIPQLDILALRSAWAGMFGRMPPKGLSRRLLELAAAYYMQAKVYGGLSPAIRRKLMRIAATKRNGKPIPSNRHRPAPKAPGSRLVREWHGQLHTVEVTDHGYLYLAHHYRSLSEIARKITGARWSGPRFFGL